MKKILLLAVGVALGAILLTAPSYAATTTAQAETCGEKTSLNFFSFPTWYRGLPQKSDNGNCTLDLSGKSPFQIIMTVALNVIDILLRAIAFISVGFTIYGGFLYMTSRGNADQVTKGKRTITYALVGLVLAMVASMLVTFIVSKMLNGAS
jgi:hypothetical protein